jgi:hypothetical protein
MVVLGRASLAYLGSTRLDSDLLLRMDALAATLEDLVHAGRFQADEEVSPPLHGFPTI